MNVSYNKYGDYMEFRELDYFIEIVKYGNLSQASESLFVTQPTLTKYIQRIEEEVGTPLFKKAHRKMILTDAGEIYYKYVKKILADKHDMDAELNVLLKTYNGTLKIGMTPVRSLLILPFILDEFKKKYPNIQLQVIENNSEALKNALIDGSIDIAFYIQSELPSSLNSIELANESFYAIISKDNEVTQKAYINQEIKCINPEYLNDQVFLLQNKNQRHAQFAHQMIEQKQLKPKLIIENNNILAAASLAIHNYGIAFLSENILKFLSDTYKENAYLLTDIQFDNYYVASYRKNTNLTEYENYLIELIKQAI